MVRMTKKSMPPRRTHVVIQAPARLHMGFVDLNGGLGRRYGSLGVGLRDLYTRVVITPASDLSAAGFEAERTLGYALDLCRRLQVPPAAIEVAQTVPAHVGLGSGTQLALAVGVGLARLYGLPISARGIARFTERGARSGVGLAVFEQGGFALDGGRGRHEDAPPVIFQAAFPEAWRFILVLDTDAHGLHGPEELSAFERLPAFPAERAGHLCRLALMQLLPALMEQDLPGFGAALTELQQIVGDHFAPAQGGRFTSRRVAQALAWLERAGATGIGQSSWGPTGFAIAGDPAQAAQLSAGAEREFGAQSGLRFLATAAANHGAAVQFGDARAAHFDSTVGMARRRIGART